MDQEKDEAPDQTPEEEKDEILKRSVRQIVLSRETIPRAPRWARAFRATLLRFNREIAEDEGQRADDESSEHPKAEEEDRK